MRLKLSDENHELSMPVSERSMKSWSFDPAFHRTTFRRRSRLSKMRRGSLSLAIRYTVTDGRAGNLRETFDGHKSFPYAIGHRRSCPVPLCTAQVSSLQRECGSGLWNNPTAAPVDAGRIGFYGPRISDHFGACRVSPGTPSLGCWTRRARRTKWAYSPDARQIRPQSRQCDFDAEWSKGTFRANQDALRRGQTAAEPLGNLRAARRALEEQG